MWQSQEAQNVVRDSSLIKTFSIYFVEMQEESGVMRKLSLIFSIIATSLPKSVR